MNDDANKTWNLRRLDVTAFARAGARCRESVAVQQLQRLAQERFVGPDVGAADETVDWAVRGELRAAPTGGEPDIWLHLEARTQVPLTCQRCLGPVQTPLLIDRWFRFVADEVTAAAMDADCEEDLLPLEPRPDLVELLEDELLMGLPVVSLHEACPVELPLQAGEAALGAAERPNPFAALVQLKKTPP